MDEQDAEKQLFALFAKSKNLVDQEPAYLAAFGAPADKLRAGLDQARALNSQGPDLTLTGPQRQSLGGQRFPDLQGVGALFSGALARNSDIVEEILAAPILWDRLIELDQAIGRYIWVAQLMWHGGECGEVLTGAAAQGLALSILKEANDRKVDPKLQTELQFSLATLFTEANRLDDERRQREQQARQIADKAGQPYQDQINQSQQNEAVSNLIDQFLASEQRGS